ncbi:MAG: hypothetical protein HRU43_05800 [Simkaniaceae bacterium]|nr:hypothetical protein [Simkaniaceae bacterium]
MASKVTAQFVLTAAVGTIIGGIGLIGVRKVSSIGTPSSAPFAASMTCAAVATASTIALEKCRVHEKLQAKLGEKYHYEEIAFMALTFAGTALLTCKVAPNIFKSEYRALEATSLAVPSTAAAIMALLWTTPPKKL